MRVKKLLPRNRAKKTRGLTQRSEGLNGAWLWLSLAMFSFLDKPNLRDEEPMVFFKRPERSYWLVLAQPRHLFISLLPPFVGANHYWHNNPVLSAAVSDSPAAWMSPPLCARLLGSLSSKHSKGWHRILCGVSYCVMPHFCTGILKNRSDRGWCVVHVYRYYAFQRWRVFGECGSVCLLQGVWG